MRRAKVFLVVILGLAARMAGAQQCPDGSPPPCAVKRPVTAPRSVPGPQERARRFLFLPLRNVTRGPAQEWLVAGGALMLAEALGHYGDLTVVPEEQLTAARRRLHLPNDSVPDASQLRRLAEETDGWTAVTGNIFVTGSRLRITVQALDVPTSRVLVRAETDVATDGDVRDAFNRLGTQLLEAAGAKGATSDGAALTTRSVDAYRAYVEGVQLMQQSSFRRAQLKFAEAVRLDSTFALAWSRLALVAIGWDVEALLNPLSLTYRAIEQAARNASKLPTRQALTIRGWQSFFRGEIRRARQLADSLVTTDRDDLDSRELLLIIEMFDPTLAPGPTPRLASSWNNLVSLARELLDRDPGRRYVYGTLAYAYGTSAGLWGGTVGGARIETGSLAARLSRGADISFVPVLRDSITFVPRDEFNRLPLAERARLTRRSADAAMDWIERWIGASPADADAHLWASRVAELRDEIPRALREVTIADSLGVEVSSLENVVGRRLSLLVQMGNYTPAAALAESLLASGSLASRPFRTVLDRRRPNSVAALILTKRWSRLAALAQGLGVPAQAQPACSNLELEFNAAPLASVPATVRRAIQDSVAVHFGEASADPLLARCVETLASGLWYDSTTTTRTVAGSALLQTADSLQRAGNLAVAYRAARAAGTVDTARHSALLARPWFAQRSLDLAVGRHFSVNTAVVEGDSATFSFRRVTTDTIVIDSPGLATNWYIRPVARSPRDSVLFVVWLAHGAAPTDSGAAGGVSDMLKSLQTVRAYSVTTTVAPDSRTSVAATSDGFRIVVRGAFVTELLRVRPTEATVFTNPCIGVTTGLCGRSVAQITYR